MACLTLTEVKSWLGIEPSNTTHDAVLTIINDAICTAVTNYVETSFEIETKDNEIQDGNESDIVIPFNSPVVSIANLYFYVDTQGNNGTVVEPTYYTLRDDMIVLRGIRTPKSRNRIRIDYAWGYDGLPDDVRMMMLQAVEAEFRRKGNKTLGVGSRTKKDESETYTGDGAAYWDYKTGLPKVLVYKLNYYKSYEFPVQPMATRNW